MTQPKYYCSKHGDQTDVYLKFFAQSKNLDKYFCLECVCELLEKHTLPLQSIPEKKK